MLYGIASGDVEVAQLYQLAGGDIYCILKSSKSIGIQSMTGLQDPAELSDQNEEQTLEYRMRGRTFWESGFAPKMCIRDSLCTMYGALCISGNEYYCCISDYDGFLRIADAACKSRICEVWKIQ